jgi:hypothetical protein
MDSLPPSSPLKPTHRSGWAAWLLPQDAKRRLRTEQTAVAGLFSIASIGFLQYAGWAGYASLLVVQLWSLVTLGGSVGFFLAIRSGWSERLKDPSLTIAQMVYAFSACAMAYMHTGPVRGALVTLLMVVMMFGMFALSTRKVLAVGLFALTMFALAMTVSAYRQPQVVPAAVEWGHFIMLALAMPAVAVLAERLKRLRRRLQDQKRELRQALDEIHQMATHDSLTGLMNRRCLDELLDKEIRRSARSGARLCLALIDLDHFKRINDQHGHACGDEVLRAFARDVGQKVRITDALGRRRVRAAHAGRGPASCPRRRRTPAPRAGAVGHRARHVDDPRHPVGRRGRAAGWRGRRGAHQPSRPGALRGQVTRPQHRAGPLKRRTSITPNARHRAWSQAWKQPGPGGRASAAVPPRCA